MTRCFMRFRIVATILVGIAMTGCGTNRPFELWQRNLDDYVANHGNGDITCLRNVDPESPRPTFGAEKGATLAQGVLVGCEQAGSRLWWVYVVGASRDGQLKEVRVLAVTDTGDGLAFSSSIDDDAATEQYLLRRRTEQRQYRTDNPSDATFAGAFPGPTDVFTMSVAGMTASVSERNSGARWSLLLTESQQQ
jgi:hypothetical protein